LPAVRAARFQAPRRLNPQAPRALEAVCLKALARDPDKRYQSAADLAREVRRHLAGDPVSALPPATWSRPWRWLRGQH
jgi:serine/threonine protein kinase